MSGIFSAFKFSSVRVTALLAACALQVPVNNSGAQDALEFQELQDNLRTAYARIKELEASGGGQSKALQESAASANAENAELKERYTQLRGLLDALDISALDQGGDAKADRLVAALNDLRLSQQDQQALATSLVELLNAASEYSQTAAPGNPDSARRLGSAMENAESALKTAASRVGEEPRKELSDARILSVKADLGVVVLDIGNRDGVKPGMPFSIFREDKPIAKVLITDVRDSISGAVVREIFSQNDKLQVGDRGQADAS